MAISWDDDHELRPYRLLHHKGGSTRKPFTGNGSGPRGGQDNQKPVGKPRSLAEELGSDTLEMAISAMVGRLDRPKRRARKDSGRGYRHPKSRAMNDWIWVAIWVLAIVAGLRYGAAIAIKLKEMGVF